MKKLLLILLFTCISIALSFAKDTLPINRTGTTLFENAHDNNTTDKIIVKRVVLVQETDNSLVLDVVYNYNSPDNLLQNIKDSLFQEDIPSAELKLSILPDMAYYVVNLANVEKGNQIGRVTIEFSGKKLDNADIAQIESNQLTISFNHYPPKKFNGAVYSMQIPFKKLWKTTQTLKP